jgi:PAS domain S-box-containing protein
MPSPQQDPQGSATERNAQLSDWIVEQTADALIYADTAGRIERWNEGAWRLFGFTASEAIGQSLDLIIPEHLRAAHWGAFDKAVASGTTRLAGRPALTRAVHKDGRKLYVEMTFALVKDQAGQVAGSVAMARDVTQRVEAERTSGAGRGTA